MKVNYAIVFVSDMKRSVEFYKNVLGLLLKFETTHWTEFETEGATLALHLSDGVPVPEKNNNPEPPGSCRPGLQVSGLDEFHKRMKELGVKCVQDPKEVFGKRIAQYTDPDGLIFSVSEKKTPPVVSLN